ncbi:MAG: phosphotransferase [Pseudomonadota bacterium]
MNAVIEQISAHPWWREPVTVAALEGGITNHNFVVTRTSDNSKYVVRLGNDIPVHHISRSNEVRVSRAAFDAGLSPAIRHHEPGILIMDFVEASTLSAEDVATQQTLERILPVVQRCHHQIPRHLRGAAVAFWVFHVIRDYLHTLKEGSSVHTDQLPELFNAAEQLEALSKPYEIVFGHNDLLSANFLDDGDKIWLIDWEYAGYNTPLFDLGGLASNNALNENQERWLLQHYFDTQVSDNLWLRYQAMKTASLLRETLWSMVSEIHSTIDFDYSDYSKENLAGFKTSMSNFQELLS